jgi:hypothetical protein
MDQLKRFIRDNREDFDVFEPKDTLWDKINQQLPPEPVSEIRLNGQIIAKEKPIWKNFISKNIIKIAASMVLISTISVFLFTQYQHINNPNSVMASVSPDDAKVVFQYASLIERKRDELKTLEAEDPQLYQEFAEDIDRLNADYEKLRVELPQSPNQEDVIQAMIQNLQSQLGILNQQLQIIQKIKQAKQSHENTI